jgi:hypothetical protein
MRKFYTGLKNYHSNSGVVISELHHFFMVEFLETSIYMLLDYCINSTAE